MSGETCTTHGQCPCEKCDVHREIAREEMPRRVPSVGLLAGVRASEMLDDLFADDTDD